MHSHPIAVALAVPLVLWASAAQAEPQTGWANGANAQPASLLTSGPLTWSLLVDTYYGFDFNRPADHTVYPTTTAPRHNEFNLNHAFLGAEVTGVENVLGKLVLQTGNYVDTLYGADPTLNRGAYSGILNLHNVQQAYAGYKFPWGTWVTGIFPAYVGLESYINQENWNYTHSLLSDFTPYYLVGTSLQRDLRDDLAGQVWLVNGWQSVSKFGEGMGVGWQLTYHPTDRLSLVHNFLGGNFDRDQGRTRFYADNSVQWQYARPAWAKRLSLAAVADLGYETAGTLPATVMGGLALYHRAELDDHWALGLRGSAFGDPQQLLALTVPAGQALPDGGTLMPWEVTATLDYKPSAWLLYRLEYRHDGSNIPFIAGPGGITGSAPNFLTSGDRVTANVSMRL
ncbi:MAG: outer membrane protein [Cyanobacteria bacterium RYN_339]|nr:outer membrane protein [Cyanobacteria bacterium RYN_339]